MKEEFGWCYAIMKNTDKGKFADSSDSVWYEIHEIYNVPDKSEKTKMSWTERGLVPRGDTPQDLIHVLEMMLKDAKKNPIFDYKTGEKVEDDITKPLTNKEWQKNFKKIKKMLRGDNR